jgi:diguanylate cyclase (GGDEF)-like protein
MRQTLKLLSKLLGLRRIGMRLGLSYFALLFLFIASISLAFFQVQRLATEAEKFARNDMQRLLNVQALSLETEGAGSALLLIFNKNEEDRKLEYAEIELRKKRLENLIHAIENSLANDDSEQKSTLNKLVERHDAFRKEYDKLFDELELSGLESAKNVFNEQVEPARRALLAESALLLAKEKENILAHQAAEQKRFDRVKLTVLSLSVLAITIGALLAFYTRRSIVHPLSVLEENALQIAEGNYEQKVPPSKTIEVERVGKALNSMSDAIANREKEIQQLAYFDTLTHLPNRTMFLKDQETNDLNDTSLILMDVARLKTVNETLGFITGDTVILECSRRIQQALNASAQCKAKLAKLAGGMFAVLCHSRDAQKVQALITQIEQTLRDPIRCGQYTVDVNLIYGVATANEHNIKLITLMRNAEVALYAAKANTQAVVWYSDAQEASRLSHLSLLSDLRAAVQNSQLKMWLQPKVQLATMQTYGFEALVRWQHPQRGFVSPAEFVPFAERTGYISQVTHWMLAQALQSLASWKNTYPHLKHLSIAVNVSTNDLRDQAFPDRVRELLQQYDIAPDQLKLELTESGIMEDPSSAIPLLQKLRDIGIGLSIDDFGTGHSSLAYLQKLPVSELKIDRSFVIDIDQHAATQRLVKTIVEMGHGLALNVIAEGIETEAERDTLISLGCDSMQGYFASKPLYGEALQNWLAKL